MVKTTTAYQEARDGTLYWTLSFYLPAQSVGERQDIGLPDPITRALRDSIEPLFNDIADRSRPGQLDDGTYGRTVFDRLFAADPSLPECGDLLPAVERLLLRMPEHIRWTTEGQTYVVDLMQEGNRRERRVNLRRFWYQYGNGALSWHLSFDYYYADDLVKDQDGVPVTFYFLSMLQKLAWPKENY